MNAPTFQIGDRVTFMEVKGSLRGGWTMNQTAHLWDLQNETELKAMVEGLLQKGHLLAAYQIGSATQCGWRHARHPAVADVWGMAVMGRIEALRDATSRFFQSIKQGRETVFCHPNPTCSRLALPLAPFPTALEEQTHEPN